MNTMADGAAQRLVAQIGEALFGEQGLTLMELSEKVKASRGERSWPFVESPGEFAERLRFALNEFPLIGAVRHVLIENPPILAAQPSPTGQADALQLANEWRHVFDGDGHDMAGANKNTMRRFIHAIDALARQPAGGQEPDAWVPAKFFEHGTIVAMTARRAPPSVTAIGAHGEYVPLYRRCTPAQVVDLGQLRKCAADAVEFYDHGYDGHARAKVNELLALIDSQA